MHPTISYICVYNDEQQLNSLLLKLLTNINGGGGGGKTARYPIG